MYFGDGGGLGKGECGQHQIEKARGGTFDLENFPSLPLICIGPVKFLSNAYHSLRPIHWFNFQANLIWWDGPFKYNAPEVVEMRVLKHMLHITFKAGSTKNKFIWVKYVLSGLQFIGNGTLRFNRFFRQWPALSYWNPHNHYFKICLSLYLCVNTHSILSYYCVIAKIQKIFLFLPQCWPTVGTDIQLAYSRNGLILVIIHTATE
jgi:hypothetical protein